MPGIDQIQAKMADFSEFWRLFLKIRNDRLIEAEPDFKKQAKKAGFFIKISLKSPEIGIKRLKIDEIKKTGWPVFLCKRG